jgi:PAS domain S-box-containing protein
MARQVLLVDVSPALRDQLALVLPDAQLTCVSELDSTEIDADAIVCEWDQHGQTCCEVVRTRQLRVPVIGLLATRDEALIVAAMRAGASDVVVTDRLGRMAELLEHGVSTVSAAPPSAAMQLSEKRFRSMWDSDILLVTVIGWDGRIVDVNDAFAQRLGWTREELREMSWAKLTPSDWNDTEAVARTQLLQTGRTQPWEKEVFAKDGQRIPLLASAVRMPGNPPQALAFALDLSEHKRLDRELHDRVRIATATADLAVALTLAPSLEAALQQSCDAILRTFALQRVELWTVEETSLQLRAACGDAATQPVIELSLSEQCLSRAEWPARWSSQLPPHAGFERFAMAMGGELVGVIRLVGARPLGKLAQESIATIANASALVVERARAEARKDVVEAELRQAQKLEAIGRLAGGVAHDFNNLLSVIIGYARLARDGLPPEDELRSMIAEIEAAGERAKNLTAQLLAFGHRQVMQPRVMDLDSAILDLRSILQRLLSEAIELVIERAHGSHLLFADPHHIEQVLMNLVVNARDAISGAGKVTIATELVASDGGEKLVKLSVSDTGSGMDATVRARMFEPFFTTKPQGAGTGLGLSTVFGIVKQSGGCIHVESELGHGTRFELLFPAVKGPVHVASLRPAAPVIGGHETILLCEDDRQVRAICRDALARYGYRVLEAADARQALRVCESMRPGSIDMLLTDVVMPVMSGRQLAERIQDIHPNMPVLFMSGYMDDTVLREGVSQDVVQFLPKPIHPDALANKVREVLDTAAVRRMPTSRSLRDGA